MKSSITECMEFCPNLSVTHLLIDVGESEPEIGYAGNIRVVNSSVVECRLRDYIVKFNEDFYCIKERVFEDIFEKIND